MKSKTKIWNKILKAKNNNKSETTFLLEEHLPINFCGFLTLNFFKFARVFPFNK